MSMTNTNKTQYKIVDLKEREKVLKMMFDDTGQPLKPTNKEDNPKATTNDSHYQNKIQPLVYEQSIRTSSQFEGAMLFNLTKYIARFGNKAGNSKTEEARKILNYAKALYLHTQGKQINPERDFE